MVEKIIEQVRVKEVEKIIEIPVIKTIVKEIEKIIEKPVEII